MGLIERVSTPTRRIALFATLALLAAVGAAALWIGDTPWAAVILLAVAAMIIATIKGLLEVVTRLQSFTSKERAAQVRLASLEAAIGTNTGRHEELNGRLDVIESTVLDRVRAVESAGRRQEGFNDAVLDRVRAVESAGRRQEGFNDAVLDRVRVVESAGRRQEGFNDAVLDRVRSLEKATKRQSADFDATAATVGELKERVERVQAMLESVVRYRDHRASGHAELHLVDELRRLRSELDSRS